MLRDRYINQVLVTAATYLIPLTMDQVYGDATAGNQTFTLQRAKDKVIRRIAVQKIDAGANTITVTDGTLNVVLGSQNEAAIFEIDGDGLWHVFSTSAGSSGNIGGSGTAGNIPLFTGPTTIGDSLLNQSSGVVSVGSDFGVEGASGRIVQYEGAPPADGELLIGDTGNGFAVGNLASADGSVAITPGPGAIDLSAAGAASPGAFATNTLILLDDVADAELVGIGLDEYEVEVVNTDSNDNTANGDFDDTTNPLLVVDADASYPGVFAQGVGDLVRIENEIMRVTAKTAADLTFQRGVSGTVVAAHADAADIFIGDGVGAGSIAVGLVTTLTPAAFAAALIADINSEGTEDFTASDSGDDVVITADAQGVAGNGVACAETLGGAGNEWVSNATFGGADAGTPAFRVYRATLTQTGTDPPVATVLENTFPGVPVWSYNGAGDYDLTLTGAFLDNRTGIFHGDGSGAVDFAVLRVSRPGVNVINLLTLDVDLSGPSATPADELLTETYFEVRVYD